MVTPYQRVAQVSSYGLWLSIAGLVTVCGYYIVKELLPTSVEAKAVLPMFAVSADSYLLSQTNESGYIWRGPEAI